MADTTAKQKLFKILIVGDLGVGKTSTIKRYVHGMFSSHYKSTIGVDFALKVIPWDADTSVCLQLWDIAGQERFGKLTRVYYKEAVGALVVFDVTRASTFDGVTKWKSDIDEKVTLPNGQAIPVVLLANKCDLARDGLTKNSAQLDKFCEDKGFLKWFETSAKDDINIDTACRFLVSKIMENDALIANTQVDGKRDDLVTPGQDGPAKASGGCC